MTDTAIDRPRRLRSTLTRIDDRAAGVPLSGHATHAPTPAPSRTAALTSLMSESRSIAFARPGKPAQMIVAGRHGYTTTGGFNFMFQQIRLAAGDCAAGRDVSALQHIITVRELLEHRSPI